MNNRTNNGVLRLLAFALLLGLLLSAAARAELVLMPVTTTVAPGGRIEVMLFLPNDSAESRAFDLPVRLTLRVQGTGATAIPETAASEIAVSGTMGPESEAPVIVVLEPVEVQAAQVHITPGGFHRALYAGNLPPTLAGDIVLWPVDFDGSAVVIHVPAPQAAIQPEPETALPPQDPDAARFATAFSPFEPNYIVAGSRGPTTARFQVSLKFRLFNPDTKTAFLERLYLGYSQTSIWNLSATSKPFYDSSYRPSFFYFDDKITQWPFRRSRLGLQAGYEHESNGKDGADSRSVDIAYVKPTFTFPMSGNYYVSFAPKVYQYVDREDNPDIAEYRGYGDYILKIGETDGWQFTSTTRVGTRSGVYSFQLDVSYPLRRPTLGNLGGYLHLQYFNGYGESLLDYNQRSSPQIRFGLMITR